MAYPRRARRRPGAGLNQDTIRHDIDVPAMNFSILEQRSTQFPAFLQLIQPPFRAGIRYT